MRVVVDARSGAIRDANRIVPGPGSYGQAEFGPYGAPASFSASAYGEPAPPSPNDPDLARLPAGRAAAHPRVVISPPLPRPRPAALAKTDSKAELKPAEAAAPAASSKPSPLAKTDSKAELKPAEAAAPAASSKPAPIND
jgi:hypothetical protein